MINYFADDQFENGSIIFKLNNSADPVRQKGTWTLVNSPVRKTLLDINMVDDSMGWAIGVDGMIIRYEYGCWKRALSPTTMNLVAVEMRSQYEGWAIGNNASRSLVLLNYKNNNWTIWGEPEIVRQYSKGDWEIQMSEGVSKWVSHAGYYDLDLFGVSSGVVIGGQLIRDYWILSSLNDQGDWEALFEWSLTPFTLLGISLLDNGDGWGVGTHTVLEFEDGNIYTTWPEPADIPAILTAVSTVNSNDAWAVGMDGVIAHYDGGEWAVYKTGMANVDFFDIDMLSENEGWVVGSKGTILHFLDGIWYLHSQSQWDIFKPTIITAVDMVSEDEGWAVGSYGQIWHFQRGE